MFQKYLVGYYSPGHVEIHDAIPGSHIHQHLNDKFIFFAFVAANGLNENMTFWSLVTFIS